MNKSASSALCESADSYCFDSTGRRLFMRVEWAQNLASPLHWARLGLAPHRSATLPCRYVHPNGSPRSPLPAAAQVVAEAALQRQNMLLGADKGGSAAAVPIPSTSARYPPLAPPPLPEGWSDPVQSDRVSLSPRASQAAAGARPGWVAQGNAASPAPRAASCPCGCCPLAAAGGR